MSADMPRRPDSSDDLDAAYARAQALADDGRGPSASVRANVLAAAREVAAQARTRVAVDEVAVPPLTPVAPPVAAVGQGRPRAINLSSWRVRSGAALCAVLLVGLAAWRFDASRRFGGDTQVAAADASVEMKVLEAAAPPPKDLPPPAGISGLPAASPPPVYAPAPPVDAAPEPALAKQKSAVRDKDLVVAQADQPYRAQAAAPVERKRLAAAPPAPVVARETAPPTPVETSAATASAFAPPPQPAPAPAPAAATTVLASTAPERAPVPVPAAPTAAKPAAAGETRLASVQADRDARVARARTADAVDEAKKSAGAVVGASTRVLPTPLQSAADRGDVDTLKKLLADPVNRVDLPDADGRTALLHAVLAQQPAAVRLLLDAGADPGRGDRAGLTPRAAAQAGANAEIGALLAAPR